MEAETAGGDAPGIDAESAWANEAFEAFANDVLVSPLFKARVDHLVDERLSELWTDVSDLWAVVADLRAELDRMAPPPATLNPPTPPTRLTPGTSLSYVFLQKTEESESSWCRARNALNLSTLPPIPRLARVGIALIAATAVSVVACPHPGVVADVAPAEFVVPVYVPMPGTPDAPLPVYDVAVQPPNDARFPTTTVTR